jgi:RHS repeat-associated protein
MTTLTTPPLTGFPSGITMAQNTYDSFGRISNETVPIQGTNATATYNYYYSGYRNAAEDPQGHSVAHYYDDKMREIAMEDPLGKKTTQDYDGQNHVVKVTDALGNATSYTYDGKNNLTKTTNALGYWVTNTYDTQFRLTDTTDYLGHTSHFTYDAKHHLLSARDPIGDIVSATYKANGLKWTTTDANGTQNIISYDTYGNIKTTATGSHPAITYNYDSVSKYDIRGIRSGLTDQVGSTTSFTYNALGQLTGKTDPLNKVSSSAYDNAGRLVSKTDRIGNTITYTYAANSKLAQITYPDSTTVILTYNNLDQLVSMQDSLGTTSYVYDAAGRLTSMTDPNGFVISYTYDDLGNVKTITYPGNKTVVYTYDNLNRLKTVTNWLSQTATYADYDAAGRLPGFTNFNGTVTSYSYDNANRLTAINNQRADASVISNYTFTMDANGNRTNNVQNEPYAPSLDEGNAAYTYNTQKNRLLSTSTDSFTYDDEGQLATSSGGAYTFDYEHRLKTIGSTAQFFYNGIGNRLKAIRSGVETRYIYGAGGALLAEADSNNNITKYYIYGNALLAAVTPAGQTYCYHYNGVGSTVAITDQSQNVVNKYAYDPFGNIATNPQETISQPFKYVGQFGVLTELNGFYYMRARYYNPTVGRFISEDPIGFGGGDVNLMAYVGNNPVNFIDHMGTDRVSTTVGIIGSIATIGALIPGVDVVAIPVAIGCAVFNTGRAINTAYKDNGFVFETGKDFSLATLDIGVSLAAKSFPLTSVFVSTGILRPLDITNTIYDGLTTMQSGGFNIDNTFESGFEAFLSNLFSANFFNTFDFF